MADPVRQVLVNESVGFDTILFVGDTRMSQHTIDKLSKKIEILETENKRLLCLSKETKKQVEAFKVVLNNIPAPLYLKDVEGKYVLVNSRYEYLSDVKLEWIKGKTDFEIFPEPIAELFRSQDEEVKRKKTPVKFEETVPLVDGEYTFITLKFPLKDFQGKIYGVGGFCTDITDRIAFEKEKECLIKELREALDEVNVLSGLLPMCASCKSIRDDAGYWNKIEAYLSRHAEVQFTHSLCPPCMKKLYGKEKWYKKKTML